MRIFVVLGSIVISGMAILTGAELYAADSAETAKRKADLQRIKTEHQRRIAELKRNGTAPHRGLPQKHASSAPPTRDFRGNPVGPAVSQEPRRDFRGNQVSAVGSKGVENAVPFNAASALPPADALAHFVKTARSASTMPELLNFLPAGEAKSLQALQASYDPKQAAASRQRWRKTNPDMAEESITFLTNPPYTNRLNHLKSIADKIIEVLKVTVEGNKATLIVSTHSDAVVNGSKWPFGKATVELVGEGSAWKLSRYNDSNIVYQEQPTTP